MLSHAHARHPHQHEHDGDDYSRGQSGTVLLPDGPDVGDPVAGFLIPPDNGLAVNTGYIVSAVNSVIEWSDVAGGGRTEESLTDFWRPLGFFGFVYDVRTLYDPASGRFLVSDGATDASGNDHILVAVSNDANPGDGWTYRSFSPANPKDGIDQPALATDGSSIFVVATLGSGQTAFIDRGGLFSTDATATASIPLGAGGIYKETGLPGDGDLVFAQENDLVTVKHIDAATATIDAESNVFLGLVSPYGEREFNVPTLGTSLPLDTGDQRIYGSAYSDGFLYVTFEVLPPQGPDAGTPTAHWAKIDVHDPGHAALVAQGDVSGSQIGAGVGTFDSSIAVDGNGDVLINFTASSAAMAPTDYYVVHRAGTPDTAFAAPVEYKASAGPYVQTNAGPFGTTYPVSRWGDYSSAVADTQNPGAFWISSEYGTTPNSWQWGTAIAHVLVGPNREPPVASDDRDEHVAAIGPGLDSPLPAFIQGADDPSGASLAHAVFGADPVAGLTAADFGVALHSTGSTNGWTEGAAMQDATAAGLSGGWVLADQTVSMVPLTSSDHLMPT